MTPEAVRHAGRPNQVGNLQVGRKIDFPVFAPLFRGLAVDGEAGVRTVFEMLRDEFLRAMAICGCLSVDDIDASLVVLPYRR